MKRIVPSVPTIIVEERTLLRESIAALLHDTAYKVVASVASVSEIPDLIFPSGPAPLAILGIQDRLDETLQSVRRLREIISAGKIVAIGERYSHLDFDEILKGGVDGIVFNIGSAEALLKVFDLALLGQQVVILDPTARNAPYREKAPLLGPADHVTTTATKSETKTASVSTNIGGSLALGLATHLSDRERQVLLCIARGESNKTIGRACSITEATVKAHVKAILRKITVQNRTQAALWAIENRLSSDRNLVRPNAGNGGNPPGHDAGMLPPGLHQLGDEAKLPVRSASQGVLVPFNRR